MRTRVQEAVRKCDGQRRKFESTNDTELTAGQWLQPSKRSSPSSEGLKPAAMAAAFLVLIGVSTVRRLRLGVPDSVREARRLRLEVFVESDSVTLVPVACEIRIGVSEQ